MEGHCANGFSSFGRVEGFFFGKYFRQGAVAPICNLLPSLAANRSNPREAVFKKSALICCLNGEVHSALFAPQNRRPFRKIVGWSDYKEVNGLQIDSPPHVASPTWLLIAFCILRRNILYFVMSFKNWEYMYSLNKWNWTPAGAILISDSYTRLFSHLKMIALFWPCSSWRPHNACCIKRKKYGRGDKIKQDIFFKKARSRVLWSQFFFARAFNSGSRYA